MRYFAMIDGERRGPFELEQLVEAGVTPDTYVWCKSMSDWKPASEVADICRFFRCHIFDMMHPGTPSSVADVNSQQTSTPAEEFDFDPDMPAFLQRPPKLLEEPTDINTPPRFSLFLSIFLTIFCFPPTGAIAIYYSYRTRRTWEEANRSVAKGSKNLYDDKEREQLRRQAHEFSRSARMWTGITFFLGLIFFSVAINNVL